MITSLACYAMFVVVPRNKVQILVPAFVMIYMTLGHLHRQYINYLGWDLDFTGAQMVRVEHSNFVATCRAFSPKME